MSRSTEAQTSPRTPRIHKHLFSDDTPCVCGHQHEPKPSPSRVFHEWFEDSPRTRRVLQEWLDEFEVDPPLTHKVALAGHPGRQMSKALSSLKVSELVVPGNCHKLKNWAIEWGSRHDTPVSIFWPDTRTYGTQAGKKMNKKIVWYADCLLVVWDCQPGHATHLIHEATKAQLDTHFVLTLTDDKREHKIVQKKKYRPDGP